MQPNKPSTKTILRKIGRGWSIIGSTVFIIFLTWSFFAFQANASAKEALQSNPQVEVAHHDGFWSFTPTASNLPTQKGLIFIPGALVEPTAYAIIAQEVAQSGVPVLLIEVPLRGAFGAGDDTTLLSAVTTAMQSKPEIERWFIAGHSRGGVLASSLVYQNEALFSGLILLGTSHPRDFSLATSTLPITKVLGTKDCISEVEKSEANRHLLPENTSWIVIEGGNHSQFGGYGFQPFDCRATVGREQQQALIMEAIFEMLQVAD